MSSSASGCRPGGSGGAAGTGGSAGSGGSAGTGGGGGMMALEDFQSCSSDSAGDACKCDPFDRDACDPGENCAVWFRDSVAGLQVIALDGSDGRPATECVTSEQIPANPVGLACSVVGDGAGFFASGCEQNGVCLDGECVRTCNTENGTSFCPGQFDECEFDLGDIDYGACVGP